MDKNEKVMLREIVINNFSEYIQTTAKIRPKPFIKGSSRIPLKYQNDDYEFRNIKFWGKNIVALIKKSDGTVVASNSITVNRPRLFKVNGQDVYNQNVSTFSRATIVNILHNYFKPYLKDFEPLEGNSSLTLEMIFNIHDMGKRNVDNDNKWIWRKCFQDTLVLEGKLPDDNVYCINKNTESTNLIPETESQSLIIRIYG